MPDLIDAPPADSIFAIMSPRGGEELPSIPRLGMLVDRTSFDETDDFGVPKEAIDSDQYVAAPPMMMKDGRVRRRLRWRPKAMAKRRRPKPSDSSVISMVSNVSKQSRKSLHSLASTETACVNNTTRKNIAKHPLPRPTPIATPVDTITTIGNEGDVILAKMDTPVPEPPSIKKRRPGLPPLFQRPKKDVSVTSTIPEEEDTPTTSIPLLNEDVEIEKRVDLRIRSSLSAPVSVETIVSEQELRSELPEERQEHNPKRYGFKAVLSDALFAMKRTHKQGDDDIRFTMSSPPKMTHSPKRSPSEESVFKKTGPVDVDNGAFLEAEKNLQAIHEMATEHLEQGEYTEALEVFEEILRAQLTRYGEDHARVGAALHNIGIVHMRNSDFSKAVDLYKDAVRVRKKALEADHTDVAVSLAQLGVAYMEGGKHRKAIGAFREALKIRRKTLGNEHPKVAKILNNIGCSLFELDELQVAKVAFQEALDIQRSLLRKNQGDCDDQTPISQQTMLSIASTQSNMASIKLYSGQSEEACVDLEEALLIQQCVLGDEHPLALRTQENLLWMEQSRHNGSSLSLDILTRLTASLSTKSNEKRGQTDSMLHSLYSGIDAACHGWDRGAITNQAASEVDPPNEPESSLQ